MMGETSEIPLDSLARGDDRAWGLAYPILYREIWIVLRARLRPGFGIDIEEIAAAVITDEVMPGLRDRRTDSFRNVSDFADVVRLAKAIAARRAVDTIRKVTRRGEEGLPEGWEQSFGTWDAAVDPGHENFLALVRNLKPPKPELFIDYFVGGMTYAEIAEARGMPLGSVCCHFKRGVDELRRCLEIPPVEGAIGYSHD